MIELEEKYLKMVADILLIHATDCRVLVFGSRIKGTQKKYSDLDLAFAKDDGTKLGLSRICRIKEDFEESNLPIKVDVLDYYALSPEFKKIVDDRHVVFTQS